MKKKVIPLRQALEGRVTEHHRFLLGMLTDQLRQLEALIERYSARIEAAMRPFAEAEARLMTIPGVGAQAAEVIVAEIGADMGAVPRRPATWGRGRGPLARATTRAAASGRARPDDQGEPVAAGDPGAGGGGRVTPKGKTFLGASYRRWSKRLGKKKALIAVGYKVLVVAYHLLKGATDYQERWKPEQVGAELTSRRRVDFAEQPNSWQ